MPISSIQVYRGSAALESVLKDTLDIHKQLAMARLPSLPQVLLQILELSEQPDVGLAEIGAVVGKDAGLAVKIVSTANSAYYNRGRSVASVDQCLAVIGASQVRRIAFTQSVVELFGHFQKKQGFDLRYYWYHVLCVALTARALASHLGYHSEDEAYLAGLLHDVGQLALLSVEPDRYSPMLNSQVGSSELMRQEQALFGLSHAEVGAWLLERWKLHSFFCDAVLYHNEAPARLRDAHRLAQIIMLAEAANHRDETDIPLSEDDLAFWMLGPDTLHDMAQAARTGAQQVANEMGIEVVASKDGLSGSGQALDKLAEMVILRVEAESTLPGQFDNQAAKEVHRGILSSTRMLFSTQAAALFIAENGVLRGQCTAEDDHWLSEIAIHLPGSGSCIARAYEGEIGLGGDEADNLADAQVRRMLACQCLLCLPLGDATHRWGALVIGLDTDTAVQFLRRRTLLATYAREAALRLEQALGSIERRQAIREEVAQEYDRHAGKLAHEASNPLGVVRNYIAVLRQQMADQEQARQDLDLIDEELRRVARIVQQLRRPPAASPLQASQPSSVDINKLIKDVVHFGRLGRVDFKSMQTSMSLQDGLPPVKVDGDKLKQVLLNLLFNAAEAMPKGGKVDISSSSWRTAKGQNAVEICISDNGPGLPAGVLERLYQPVQTQKGGAHQGVGLSITHQLVGELGGLLQCKSTPAGTHFKILLRPGP